MTTTELIDALRWQPGNMAFDPHIRKEAADKLEQLQELVDGLLGDHYVDYLDYYTSYCRELEDKLEMIEAILTRKDD